MGDKEQGTYLKRQWCSEKLEAARRRRGGHHGELAGVEEEGQRSSGCLQEVLAMFPVHAIDRRCCEARSVTVSDKLARGEEERGSVAFWGKKGGGGVIESRAKGN